MKMISLIMTAALATGGSVFAKSEMKAGSEKSATGTVTRYLVNLEGQVDGFLLDNGTQVNFPPHMSDALTAAVAPKDKVTLTGTRENSKVFKADVVKNDSNGKSVTEAPPTAPQPGRIDQAEGPRNPHKGPKEKMADRQKMPQMDVEGKVQTQLFGAKGEVTGAILSDDSLVRIEPKLRKQSGLKLDVGQTLAVKGFANKTPYGQVIEATEVKNK